MSGTPRLSNQAASAATAPIATPVVLVELDFATGPFRVWTGLGPLDWAEKVFEGAGSIGAISDVEETVELRAVRSPSRCRRCRRRWWTSRWPSAAIACGRSRCGARCSMRRGLRGGPVSALGRA